MQDIPHYFIDHLSVQDAYSVGDYHREATALLEKIYTSNTIAILTGGTGLYIRAVCEGLNHFPPVDRQIRSALHDLWQTQGIALLQEELRNTDPQYYESIDTDNPHRLIRALSVIRSSGKPFSHFLHQPKPHPNFVPIYIALTMDRDQLYARINKRVDHMIAKGLLNEVESLLPYRGHNSLNTVGYTELFEHLDGQYSLPEAIDKIKQHTRNYAKRQMTWFRNQGQWNQLPNDDIERIINFLTKKIHSLSA